MPRPGARWSRAATGSPRTTTTRRAFKSRSSSTGWCRRATSRRGSSEAAARFGSALAGLGARAADRRLRPPLVRRAHRPARRRHRRDGFGYFSIGRLALPDLPLAFWSRWRRGPRSSGLCDRPSAAPRAGCCWQARRQASASSRRGRWPSSCRRSSSCRSAGSSGGASDCRAGALAGAAAVAHRRRGAVVHRDGQRPRPRVPRGLLRRRQPRTLCDEPVQRSAAAVVLPADRRGRPAAVDAADALWRHAVRAHG